MSHRFLIVPSVAKGNGSGHLVRSIALARRLGPGAAVYVPGAKTSGAWSAAELALAYSRELEGVELVADLSVEGVWDLVLLDRRAVSLEELAFWERLGPVLALDEGGEARLAAHYLLDVLPRPPRRAPGLLGGVPVGRGGGFSSRGNPLDAEANYASLGLLDLPQHRRSPPESFRRILLSFGGEDPAGLGLRLARTLIDRGLVAAGDLTLVSGALHRAVAPEGLEGLSIIGPVQDLKEHLARYDLVFTQFGLTAFESAWAGTGVILFNPSDYHRSLARAAGFPEIGVLSPELPALEAYLAEPAKTLAQTAAVAPPERESLADFVAALSVSGPRNCPACGSPRRRALYRSRNKSYFRCGDCGMLYLTRFGSEREAPYTEGYFFEEYRRQYGRTYLEDWPALTAFAQSRLAPIEELAQKSLGRSAGLSVLDVGCAYGPFLAAAKAGGQEVVGLDLAEDAVRYVRFELDLPAVAGDFADPSVASSLGGPFDVITMWYVIEHFADLGPVLANAASLLRPGGILAFSTPSGEGVSARCDARGFFERSPEDHFTVWEPSRVGAILKARGFRVERLKRTGEHPERFPFVRRIPEGRRITRGLALLVGRLLSRLFGLGDSFEVYAVREGQAGTAPPLRGSPAAEAAEGDTQPSKAGQG